MKCYCYTITNHRNIADKFQRVDDTSKVCTEIFCASHFDNKEDCLNFARMIEQMKADVNEMSFKIYAGKRNGYFPWMWF